MTATADIETETVEEVVRVPLQAVTVRTREVVRKALEPDDEDAAEDTAEAEEEPEIPEASSNDDDEDEEDAENEFQRIVFVVNDGVAEMRVVETGISDGRFIEILEGLEAGETVVTGRYSVLTRELEHEDAVEVEEREDRRGNGNRD